MNFFDFYNEHFISMSVIIIMILSIMIGGIMFGLKKIFFQKQIKTPWFEIASDSITKPETEAMGKTRLLLKRQSEYLEQFMNGLQPIFLAVVKEVVKDAMVILFDKEEPPKTHMETCLIQSATNSIVEETKLYLNNLLIINHIGTNKEKIKKYAKGHIRPVMGIVRKECCDLFCRLSGQISTDTLKYWKKIGIEDPSNWTEQQLSTLLLDLSDLRYSDFEHHDAESSIETPCGN